MIIGYARVSTLDQSLELQVEALEKFGCELIYKEKKSAVKERKQFNKMNKNARGGDTIVVWKLDRLGRSLRHLINQVNDYKERDIELVSIQDKIDTTSATGRLMFNMIAIFAEFERDLISDRTRAGLEAARKNGRKGGRPKGITNPSIQKAWAIKGYQDKNIYSENEIMKITKTPKTTYYRLTAYIDEVIKKSTKKG